MTLRRRLRFLLPFASAAPIGGQAVLEGVMMRSPSAWSVAVRKPDGEIAEVNRPITSFSLRHRWARIPVIRGVIALGESLAIGFRALAISANYAAQEEIEDGEDISTELTRGQLLFAFGLMLVSFRSIVVALKAIVLNILYVCAASGIIVAVFPWS